MRVEGTDSNPSEALTETDSSGVEAFTLTAGDDYAHECWWAALSDVARFRVTQATKGGTGALTYYKLTPEQRREFERAGW